MAFKEKLEDYLRSLDCVDKFLVCCNNGTPLDCKGEWSTQYQIYNTSYAGSVMYDALTNINDKPFKYAIIENSTGRQIIAPIYISNASSKEKNKDLKLFLFRIANKSVRLRELIENTMECVKNIERIVALEVLQLPKSIIEDYDPSALINVLKSNRKDLLERDVDLREIEKICFLHRYSDNLKLEFEELIKTMVESFPQIRSVVITLKNGYIIKQYIPNGFIRENEIEFLTEKARLFLNSANRWSWLLDKTRTTKIFIEYDTFYHFVYNLSRSTVNVALEKTNAKAKFLERIFEEYEIYSWQLEKFTEKVDCLVKYVLKSVGNLKWLNNCSEKSNNSKEKIKVKELLTERAIKILEKVKSYDNNFTCSICKKEIVNSSYPNYFQLYASVNQKRFAIFHLKCALKEGANDKFNELTQYFDYIYPMNKTFKRSTKRKRKKIRTIKSDSTFNFKKFFHFICFKKDLRRINHDSNDRSQ